MTKICTTSTILPFQAFRPPLPGGGLERHVEIIASLDHFYHSEKFRGINETLRREVLIQPTAREARKFALSNKDKQRDDWGKVRGRVMCCGFWMQAIEHPRLVAALSAGEYRFGGVHPYWAPRRGGDGAFGKFVEYLEPRLATPTRVFVCGVGAPLSPFRFESKMQLLFSRKRPDEIIISDGQGLDAIAEQWAAKLYVAVRRRHPLKRLSRITDARIEAALTGATHAVIFGAPKNPDVIRLVALARKAKVVTRVIEGASEPTETPSSGSVLSMSKARDAGVVARSPGRVG